MMTRFTPMLEGVEMFGSQVIPLLRRCAASRASVQTGAAAHRAVGVGRARRSAAAAFCCGWSV